MRPAARRYSFALALAILYLYAFPYFPDIQSANELPRVYLTRAIAEEGTFAIDTGVERWGTTVDVSEWEGRAYSNKAPGSSFLAVPAYYALVGVKAAAGAGEPTLAEMMWTFRVAAGVIPTLLFLIPFSRFLGRFAPAPDTRRLVVAAYALGTMAMTYSVLFIAHQLAAICIAAAYIATVRACDDGAGDRWLFAAGLAAGAAPLVDYQAAFAGVPVAAYALYKLVGHRPRRWRGVAAAVAGAAPPVLLLLWYHARAFGSPFRTGYHTTETFAHYHQEGFLGMTGPSWEAFAGSMVSPAAGLLVLSPVVLLAVPGWVALWRRGAHGALAITLAVCAFYVYFVSSLEFWHGGWTVGPRYITAMLPFCAVAMAAGATVAEARAWTRALAVAAAAVSITVYATTAAVFPHFPGAFENPLYEVTFALLGDGHISYNIGWIFGLSGTASLIPYLAILAGVLVWAAIPSRAHLRSGLAGLALAGAIVAAYGAFPRGGDEADEAYGWITEVVPVCARDAGCEDACPEGEVGVCEEGMCVCAPAPAPAPPQTAPDSSR